MTCQGIFEEQSTHLKLCITIEATQTWLLEMRREIGEMGEQLHV